MMDWLKFWWWELTTSRRVKDAFYVRALVAHPTMLNEVLVRNGVRSLAP